MNAMALQLQHHMVPLLLLIMKLVEIGQIMLRSMMIGA